MKPKLNLTVALLATLAAAAPALAQYKWLDSNGRVMYGDNPPRDAKKVEKLGSAAPDDSDPLRGAGFELRRAVQAHPVVLYATGDCSPCESARQLLRARGVPYTEKLIVTQADIDALRNLGGGNQVPVLTVGRQVQQLFETNTWHSLLDAAGYPRASQLPRSWQPATPTPLVPPPPQAPPKTAETPAAPSN
jgi:glutaredoxin